MKRLNEFFQINVSNILFYLCALLNICGTLPKITTDTNSLDYKAREMRSFMNESVDPCDDFYEFACGNWPKVKPINAVEHERNQFTEMQKVLNQKLNVMLTAGAQPDDSKEDRKVKDFFESCTKIRNLRHSYKGKLLQIIGEFGKMPALHGKKWNEKSFNWLETIAKIFNRYGKTIIIELDIMPDFANNEVNRPMVGQPNFPLSKFMYVDKAASKYRKGYADLIQNELKGFLGMKYNLAKKTASEIVDFEVQLAKGMWDLTLGVDFKKMIKLTTVEKMQQKYAPTIDFNKYLNIAFGEPVKGNINEYVNTYLEHLKFVIENTPKKKIANYIFYRLLKEFFVKPLMTRPEQEAACVTYTKTYFAKNLDNMIYRKSDTKTFERDINLIYNELKTVFKVTLETKYLNWIKVATRRYAFKKLDAMKLEMNSYVNENLAEDLSGVVFDKSDYIENIKTVCKLYAKKRIAKLHLRPTKSMDPALSLVLSYTPANIVNENKIKVPVSMLLPTRLWDAKYPIALNFGTLGTLTGHELIHGFDDIGRGFDMYGNIYNWWDKQSSNEFIRRSKCFNDQYSQYIHGGQHLPKNASQAENIADSSGLSLAYGAYRRWHDIPKRPGQKMPLKTLPSMNYTSHQLFFISFAQLWCNNINPNLKATQLMSGHAPGKIRVIGSLSNFIHFAKDFKCAPETNMNPTKKCRIY